MCVCVCVCACARVQGIKKPNKFFADIMTSRLSHFLPQLYSRLETPYMSPRQAPTIYAYKYTDIYRERYTHTLLYAQNVRGKF